MNDQDTGHACTVPTVEQPLRSAGFDELFAESLDRVSRVPGDDTKVRLVLSGGRELEHRLRTLTEEESSCCSFFRFQVKGLEGVGPRDLVALDVEVPSAHVDVLSALIDRAVAVADEATAASA